MTKDGAVLRMDYDAYGMLTSLVGPRPARARTAVDGDAA
jgi:hypothetical protein